eukprot:GHVL01027906.1.p1 GENE.GHVL01027906.1~~GHVL01027906.1.p1  ORF type:complete len:643 (-),score=104.11 GHVL01027906.1:2090-4018(-)
MSPSISLCTSKGLFILCSFLPLALSVSEECPLPAIVFSNSRCQCLLGFESGVCSPGAGESRSWCYIDKNDCENTHARALSGCDCRLGQGGGFYWDYCDTPSAPRAGYVYPSCVPSDSAPIDAQPDSTLCPLGCSLTGGYSYPSPFPPAPPPTSSPTYPAPTYPAPTYPAPTQPAPTQPAPTQPAPTQPILPGEEGEQEKIVSCASQSECPHGYVCYVEGGVCIKNGNCPLQLRNFQMEYFVPAQVYATFQLVNCENTPISGPIVSSYDPDINIKSGIIFKVTEDGEWDDNENKFWKLQDFTYQAYILFLVDMSGSARSSLLSAIPTIKDLSKNLCQPPRHCALYAFDGSAKVHRLIDFPHDAHEGDTFSDLLDPSIKNFVVKDQSTNLYGTLIESIVELQNDLSQARNETTIRSGALILFSDGNDKSRRKSRDDAIDAVQSIRGIKAKEPIHLFAVKVPPAIGSSSDDDFMSLVGGTTSTYTSENHEQLSQSFRKVFKALTALTNSFWTIGFCSAFRNFEEHKVLIEATFQSPREQIFQSGSSSGNFNSSNFEGGCSVELLQQYSNKIGEIEESLPIIIPHTEPPQTEESKTEDPKTEESKTEEPTASPPVTETTFQDESSSEIYNLARMTVITVYIIHSIQ